ncbi:hypothetical protein FGRMN_1021 [Fusarium graminum]|nr:hypothetical protein FGRMN_1021 [Fusarium graminum]
MATTTKSPLAFMDVLSPAVSYFRPNESASIALNGADSKDPPLIIVMSWSEARDVHIAKYISQYRALYPTSAILLFRASSKLYIRPGLRRRLFEPALPILQSLERTKKEGPEFLLHVFSNGGISSAVTLWELWGPVLGNEPVPRHAVVMDSCPGYFHWKRSHHVISVDLPSFMSPLVWVLLGFGWVYYVLWLNEEPQEANASVINTSERIDRETMRTYIYGDADLSVGWEDVESHAQEAKKKGAVVRTEKFAGGAHVAHIRVDAESSLSLGALACISSSPGGASLTKTAMRGRRPLEWHQMIILQAADTFIFFVAYRTFLVEIVLIDKNTSRASAKPSHVLGIETGKLLC